MPTPKADDAKICVFVEGMDIVGYKYDHGWILRHYPCKYRYSLDSVIARKWSFMRDNRVTYCRACDVKLPDWDNLLATILLTLFKNGVDSTGQSRVSFDFRK